MISFVTFAVESYRCLILRYGKSLRNFVTPEIWWCVLGEINGYYLNEI